MKLGINTTALNSDFNHHVEECFQKAAGYGFELLELVVREPEEVNVEAVLQAKIKTGLEVSVCGLFGMGEERDLSSEDPRQRQRAVHYIKSILDVAAETKALSVGGPFFAPVGKAVFTTQNEYQQQMEWITEGLAECGRYARQIDVPLLIEPINRYETHLVLTSEQAVGLINQIEENTNLGILLDTYHMNIEEADIRAGIEEAGKRLKEIHACGIGRGVPGRDHFDWRALVEGCRKIGFDGNLVIESFSQKEQVVQPLPHLWRPLAEEEDAVAVEGICFLQWVRKQILRS